MISPNDLSSGMTIKFNGEIFDVVEASHSHFAQRSGVMQAKLRNVKTGNVISYSFASRGADRIEEVEIEKKKVKFIFSHREKFTFAFENGQRFVLGEEELGEKKNFLKPGAEIQALYAEDALLSIELPIKMELKVVEAPPAFKGNTAGAATKTVVLETGVKVNVPIFVKEGDVVRINTQTREYVERVN